MNMAPAGEEGRRLPDLKTGDVFASRFRIESALGQGQLGRTYLVKHIKYGQKFVLKVFYPGATPTEKAQKEFGSSFKALKQMRDPGVVKYFDHGPWEEGKSVYCTCEYLNGSTLRQLMGELKKQGKRFSGLDVVQICVKLLETLKKVHLAGISHLNIKPENVLIVTRGRAADKVKWDIRLCDFALTRAPVDWLHDVSNEKLPYLAPELRGYGGEVGPRADIYAVGALLYEMVTGLPPDDSGTPPSARRKSLPRKFDDIIEMCLAYSSSDRYGSVQDLIRELQDLPAIIPFEEENEPRSLLTPIIAGLAILLFAGVIGYIATREPDVQPAHTGPALWTQLRAQVEADPAYLTDSPEVLKKRQSSAPDGMAYIPGGSFLKGTLDGEPNAGQLHGNVTVVTMPGFYIDQYEFPNKANALPQTTISWDDAEAECNRIGKRLCQDVEWERACKGSKSLIYSYGDDYDAAKCPALGETGSTPAGSDPECKSDYGVFNLSGNVAEWTLQAVESNTSRRVTKGGQPGQEKQATRCAYYTTENKDLTDPNLGFRCCKEAK